jgi:amino acid adenylation domain-containing protein
VAYSSRNLNGVGGEDTQVDGAAAAASPSTAPDRRLVQLPTDWPRTTAVGFEAARYRATARATLPGAEALAPPLFLSALGALLHRLTQQTTIALDLRWRDIASGQAASTSLDLEVDADSPVSVLTTQLASAVDPLARAAPAARPPPHANVAVTFRDPPPADGDDGDNDGDNNGDNDGDNDPWAPDQPEYDLHFLVATGAGPTRVTIAYNARLFRPQTIERLVGSFHVLAAAALADPHAPLRRLPVLGAKELGDLSAALDSGSAPPATEPVHRQFQAFARAQPAAIACAFQGQTLSYGALDERSSRLAQHLAAAGVGAGVPVAVCLRPCNDVLVALLAIWKAGGVYLPLDPTHPEALLATMLGEAQPRLVLTQTALAPLTRPDLFAQFCFDRDWGAAEARPAVAPATDVGLDQPSHLLYTSGTTGKPKGVLGTHGNLAHYIAVARDKYRFRNDDVFCALARYTFSISLFELLSPLCCGGSLRLLERDDVLDPARLARALEEITVIHAGPSLLGGLFRHLRTSSSAPRSFPGVRHASSGGDLVAPHVIEEMKRVFDRAEIYVIYGCTEVSCMGTTFPVSRDGEVTRTYVGRAFPDVAVRVLDPHRNLVPFGVVGEIAFAGAGVVPGYFQRPALTAEKFIELEGRRFYTTGDMGRLHADGNLEILGRRDFQVQVRGIRVELAGIESTIRELGLAAQCAVVAKKLDDQNVRLGAFVVSPRITDIAGFRHALAVRLPDYMLPQSLIPIDALPLTANGKLDRNRLQAMSWSAAPAPAPDAAAGAPAAARNPIERQIATAFADTLGIQDDLGIDDDFFDLGGDSLMAVMLIRALENTLGLSLPPGALFEHPTVRGLAERVHGSLSTEPRPIRLNGGGDALPPLFMLLGVHLYRELATRLEGRYAAYGVYAGRELVMFEPTASTESTESTVGGGRRRPVKPSAVYSVAELARDYIQIIRRQQPRGPYRLVGMSFGGIVAYEVAQQLRGAGDAVAFLGLLDATLPERPLDQALRLARALRLGTLPGRDVARLVWTRLRSRAQTLLAGKAATIPGRYGADARLGPLDELRERAYRHAAFEYLSRLRPFDGEVTLIVAGRRLREDPLGSATCGWSAHVPSLEVHTVDADHLALLGEPKVGPVADILRRALRRSEELGAANGVHRAAAAAGVGRSVT